MTATRETTALRADNARALSRRSIWQGSRSRLPFVIEVVVGVAVWCAWRIADRWTAHIEHVRTIKRGAW